MKEYWKFSFLLFTKEHQEVNVLLDTKTGRARRFLTGNQRKFHDFNG